ncbi:cucumber peeling cupredoxin-like protein [Trifolium pratense]|uniref:Cucumber peeling cupredoxin-like protein n=1 Tax=Trifolium pratense TaxID=57577 RepID=A0A2K3PRQ5_TRIPR|nr:cucumber peeling cupredoxin-like protein [Trifolium pratense]
MYQIVRNITILIVVSTILLQTSEAEDYIVGDVIGWTSFPPGGDSFYSKWAANFTFKLNDNLVFNYESGSHSVAILNKANYEKCNINDKNIQTFNIGPTKITLDRTGDFYFSCTLSGHCTSGQKLSVKVTDTSSSSSIPPAEAPSSTGPDATALPPQSSAPSIAATSSLLLITIAFNFLSSI